MTGDLHRYLKDPSLLEQANLSELEKIAEQFPYFSMAQVLLAKKYQTENHPKTDLQLNKAALSVNDRSRLYNFLNEISSPEPLKKPVSAQKDFSQKETELSEVLSSNEELHDMLKSIHERKQALLDSGNSNREPVTKDEAQKNFEAEQKLISEVSSSLSEFSLLSMEEENAEQQAKERVESESVTAIESEMLDQLSYEEQEDLLVMNEVGGGGAEFVATEFTQQEDQNEEFIIEQDSEVQSINVIEEEFIARESEFEEQEKEVEKISELEGGDTETVQAESIEPDISSMEIQSETVLEEELTDHESFETTEGEVQTNVEAELSITDQELQKVSSAAEEELKQETEEVLTQEAAASDQPESFRINETVETPGEFLPEKSYRYSQWLQFFRLSQPPPEIQKESPKKSDEEAETQVEEMSSSSMMQHELESIDRIVSVIHPASNLTEATVSAEELAKRSSEMDDEIVSETLAKIFETQGHYDKAIRMYVKLSLRFPEKVSFFAARIKDLKSKK